MQEGDHSRDGHQIWRLRIGISQVHLSQCDENFLMDPACQEMYRMGYSVVHDHGFHLRGPLLVGCAQKYYTISFKDARKN